jgi:glycosyltransferase involved in cell wall biosynthesis
MTYGYSLKTWNDSFALEREAKYFNYLTRHNNIKFTIVTYGDESDFDFASYFDSVEIIPIYSIFKKWNSKYINLIMSFYYPFKLRKSIIGKSFIIKQNQLLGSWVSITFKYLTKQPLFIRTGYDMYTFSVYENKSLVKRFLYLLLTTLSIKLCNIYTVSSMSDFLKLEKKLKITNNNFMILKNWVEQLEKNGLGSRKKQFVSVGRLEFQKNYKYLVNEFKNSPEPLIIYGSGSHEESLRELAKKNNTNLDIVKSIKNSKLMNELCNSMYFILPSYFEGNPKALLEAMSAGCIVFASKISNHEEIIEDGVNGFLFDLETNNLKEKIKKIEINKLDNISISAMKTINDTYSIQKIAAEEYQILLRMMYD